MHRSLRFLRPRAPRKAVRPLALICAAALSLPFVISAAVGVPTARADEQLHQNLQAVSIFDSATTPRSPADPERASVELGLRFIPAVAGSVTAIRFYRFSETRGPHTGRLWDSRGSILASIDFPQTSSTGWQTAILSRPVPIVAGREYIASYRAPQGRYAADQHGFDRRVQRPYLAAPAGAGVYSYEMNRMPRNNYRNTNYYVDVQFVPGPTVSPTPTPSPTPSVTPRPTLEPTASPTPTSTPTTTPTSGAGWTVTASSVGLRPLGLSCAQLPVYTGNGVVPRGTVISGRRITKHLDLSAGAITIERSCFQPTSVGRGLPLVTTTHYDTWRGTSERVVIRDSEFDGTLLSRELAAYATAFIGIADLSRNYVHGFGSGLAIMNAGTQLNAVIERNYVTGLVAWGDGATTGNHSDAFTIRDFSSAMRPDRSLIVRDNRFDCNSGNDTGAFFIQTYSGRIDNVMVQGNLLEGKGYQLGLEQKNASYSNMRAVNNRFTGTGWGPAYVTGGPGWTQWDSNYIYSPTSQDGRGTEVRTPAERS